MTLNSLKNISFEDQSIMDFAWYAHFQDHLEIIQAIRSFTGQVVGYTVVSGGSNYTSLTIATISPPDLRNGVQATATVGGTAGVVEGLNITNVGRGYIRTPTVVISDPGGGTGAEITLSLGKVSLAEYNIFPYSKENFDTIMLAHQEYHDDFNSVLNLDGTDLQNIVLGDKTAEASWVNQNFYEHYAARQALGI